MTLHQQKHRIVQGPTSVLPVPHSSSLISPCWRARMVLARVTVLDKIVGLCVIRGVRETYPFTASCFAYISRLSTTGAPTLMPGPRARRYKSQQHRFERGKSHIQHEVQTLPW